MISPVDILDHEDRGVETAGDHVAEGQVQYVHVGRVISCALGEGKISAFCDTEGCEKNP